MTVASRILGALAKLPPATVTAVSVDRDLAAKMSDGAELLADRWYPTGVAASDVPVILLRSPYGRRQMGVLGRLLAERGYQAVIQSVRGTFGSGGDWVPMRHEAADGRETLAWVADQPWCGDRLATFGPSYLGLTQWAVAADPPPALRAMALTVTASNFRDAVVYPAESFALETGLAWIYQLEHQERRWWQVLRAQSTGRRALRSAAGVLPLAQTDVAAVGHHVDFYQDWLVHETPGDPWWEPIDFGRRLGAVPPSSLVGGWYDLFLPAQVEDYRALRAAGRQVSLTVGPWTHASPGGMAASLRDALALFDEQLGGRPRRPRPAVRLFVMGARRWVEVDDWPPPCEAQRWHLDAGGGLRRPAPAASAPDRYRYDPTDPTPGIGGPSLEWSNAGRKDQRPREDRPDVLTYTSEPLISAVTVIGPVTAELHVRSSLEHTDFFVRLCDVSPKGRSTNLSDGLVRLRPGDVTASDDGTLLLRIALWPTANTFRPGHRIRLQVSSGAHPLFARNTGSGEPLATATSLRVADQEIFHDPEHPSCLVLPVSRL